MLPLRTNVGIVCVAILFQSVDAHPGIVLFIHIGITRPIEHIFILLHGLMVRYENTYYKTDCILSKRATEGLFAAQIREILYFQWYRYSWVHFFVQNSQKGIKRQHYKDFKPSLIRFSMAVLW